MIDEIISEIKGVIDARYIRASTLYAKDNKANFYSLMVKALPTPYRTDSGEHLFARVKDKGKMKYISFSKTFESDFALLDVPYTQIRSDEYLRIDLSTFRNFLIQREDIRGLLNKIYISSFNFQSFGCCGKYLECSNQMRCVHEDILYASGACQYKKNLEAGRIFYGDNCNVLKNRA